MLLATTGVPQAIDSSSTFAQPSRLDAKHAGVGRAIEIRQLRMRPRAQQAYAIAQAKPRNLRFERGAFGAFADDEKLELGQLQHRLDGQVMALALDQQAHGNERAPGQAERRARRVAIDGVEGRRIDAVA